MSGQAGLDQCLGAPQTLRIQMSVFRHDQAGLSSRGSLKVMVSTVVGSDWMVTA
jgi:hypothetical protein